MISLIIGIAFIVIFIGILIFSFSKTPSNLSGYYGLFYWLFELAGLTAGVLFICGGTIWGWNF